MFGFIPAIWLVVTISISPLGVRQFAISKFVLISPLSECVKGC